MNNHFSNQQHEQPIENLFSTKERSNPFFLKLYHSCIALMNPKRKSIKMLKKLSKTTHCTNIAISKMPPQIAGPRKYFIVSSMLHLI
jgi:hypothetical protein